MKFSKHEGLADLQQQMAPMIDIVFQLIIFFLVGTHIRIPVGELPADLPEQGGPSPGIPKDVDQIIVTLKLANGGERNPEIPPVVLLDGEGSVSNIGSGSMKWLEGRLAALAANEGFRKKVPVVIEAEPGVRYQWVIETLNLCRKARFEKVNFAASKRNPPA